MLIFPAVMIISAMVALNLIGNGLSAVLDPKSGLKQ
jgi:ABC-type dipeptide/oligopeptide/nickel transport system permease subunit